eukprot:4065438-Amphidinium_carterae.2
MLWSVRMEEISGDIGGGDGMGAKRKTRTNLRRGKRAAQLHQVPESRSIGSKGASFGIAVRR